MLFVETFCQQRAFIEPFMDDIIVAAHNFKKNLETYRVEFLNDFVVSEGREHIVNLCRKRLTASSLPSDATKAYPILHWYKVKIKKTSLQKICPIHSCPKGDINIIAY